jgi:hypothetical protein
METESIKRCLVAAGAATWVLRQYDELIRMADPEKLWYQIVRHMSRPTGDSVQGDHPVVVDEVRGEDAVGRAVAARDAKLSKEDLEAGWMHYALQGTSRRSSPSPAHLNKSKGGRRAAKGDGRRHRR